MSASDYTPNFPGEVKPLKVFQQIADEYEKKYPGIKIKFHTEPIPDTNTMIRVKAAAGELFDVYWAQTYNLNSTLPKGVATDLAPFFKQPNPYIPGNKAWQDVMNKAQLAESRSVSGAVYTLSGDKGAYGIYYNKDLFKKAGITKVPSSWSELIAASKRLNAIGVYPMHAVPAYPWWSRHFLSDLYSKDYAKLTGYDGLPGQSPLDEAVAISKGILTPKDPRFMSWWPLMKQFTDTWPKDYLTADPAKNYDAFQDFVGQKEAMLYEGGYKVREMQDAGVKFPVGTFNFPKLTKRDLPGTTGVNTANAYSRTGSFQYAMSTPVSNKTMREQGKPQAVLDWMRYFGTPKNLQRLAAEQGSYVPTWPGATVSKLSLGNFDSGAFAQQVQLPQRSIGAATATANLGWVDMQRIFGLYLSGNLSLDQAKKQAQTTLDRAAAEFARKNKVDLSKYR
ncbi:raffinose/stachyose/melibiose transport system substrate-binding protein [Deinococcus reticulitermitis]|uniref:Raffinose/stachyose/melibiose transport system substrate-binding protein n=2 Tax=Deinococcus reticulitermitis TaxID=856736 RepID=A0A1H7BEB3_9DEIO|nr:raffinose/stachyose/melibiose transport system substrate-binding protein [Deinococcus reticulitermitis]